MKYTITYLDDATIIVFKGGRTFIIDEDFAECEVSESTSWLKLKHKTIECCISSYGSMFWYQNGLLHRDEGPAIVYVSGPKHWYQHGKRIP